MMQALREMEDRAENRSAKKLRISKPSTITSSSLDDTNGNLKAAFCDDITLSVQVESAQGQPIPEIGNNLSLPSKKSKRGRKPKEKDNGKTDIVKEPAKKQNVSVPTRIMTRKNRTVRK